MVVGSDLNIKMGVKYCQKNYYPLFTLKKSLSWLLHFCHKIYLSDQNQFRRPSPIPFSLRRAFLCKRIHKHKLIFSLLATLGQEVSGRRVELDRLINY